MLSVGALVRAYSRLGWKVVLVYRHEGDLWWCLQADGLGWSDTEEDATGVKILVAANDLDAAREWMEQMSAFAKRCREAGAVHAAWQERMRLLDGPKRTNAPESI